MELVAEKVNVPRQTINLIEIGKLIPSAVLALKIARIFQTTIDNVFSLEDSDWKR